MSNRAQNSPADKVAIGLVFVFLIGIPVLLFVLMTPVLFGSLRGGLAPLGLAGMFILIDLLQLDGPRMTKSIVHRLAFSIAIGIGGGVVWYVVAGSPALSVAVRTGVSLALVQRGIDELLQLTGRRKRIHPDGLRPTSE